MNEPESKRKKPNYFIQKKRKQYILESGLKGFLCTCNFREKECIRESYNLLNTFADRLYPEISTIPNKNEIDTKQNSSDEDIADELSKEVNAMKSEKPVKKRFQVVESGAKNILFIRTTLENPVKLTTAIMEDIIKSKQQITRYLLRLVPIEITCKANMDEINKSFSKLIDNYFCGDPKTFAISFNHRNNNQLNRDDVIKELASSIMVKNPKHKVDLKNAEVTVLVEIIRGICLLSVIPDYIKLKKYNLLQLSEFLSKDTRESEPKVNENVDNIEK